MSRLLTGRLRILTLYICVAASVIGGPKVVRADEPPTPVITAKVNALSQLLNSKTARQIDLSESARGRAMLNDARVLFDWAQAELMQGEFKSADLNMTKALRLVSRATVLISWQRKAEGPNQQKYLELVDSIANFKTALAQTAGEGRGQFLDQRRFDNFMEKAHRLAVRRKFSDALPHLEAAYTLIERAVIKSNDNATVTYAKRFQDSKDEFLYESGRYAGYRSLVTQLAAQQPDRRAASEKLIAQSKKYHELAVEMAGTGAVEVGVGLMEEANRLMGRVAKTMGAL